jgi:hypothetical protein
MGEIPVDTRIHIFAPTYILDVWGDGPYKVTELISYYKDYNSAYPYPYVTDGRCMVKKKGDVDPDDFELTEVFNYLSLEDKKPRNWGYKGDYICWWGPNGEKRTGGMISIRLLLKARIEYWPDWQTRQRMSKELVWLVYE